MSLPPLDATLTQLIQEAWDSLQTHPNAQLRPYFRLRIYDRLVEQADGTFYKFCRTDRIPLYIRSAPKFSRYYNLGFITVKSLFPTWKREFDLFLATTGWPDDEGARRFPETLLNTAKMALEGKSDAEIDAINAVENEFVGNADYWHYMLGNIREEFVHSHYMVLKAAYDVYTATWGLVPLKLPRNVSNFATIEDSDIDRLDKHDFAYHACEAVSTYDPNPPGYVFENLKPLPIEYDIQKSLEFWQWWLFEAVPQAWYSVP